MPEGVDRPVPQRDPRPRELALPVRLARDGREPLAGPDAPVGEVPEEPADGGPGREHPRPGSAPPLVPLLEGLDQQRRREHEPDAPRERRERAGGAGHRPTSAARSPEGGHRQQEEQGLAVGHEEEVRGREQAHQQDRGARGAFGQLGGREQVGDDQPAAEGRVRYEGRGRQRVPAHHERGPTGHERIQREERRAAVPEPVAAVGDPQEPQRVESLPGREDVLPPGVGRAGGPARHADLVQRREQGDPEQPDQEHRQPQADEREEAVPDRAEDAVSVAGRRNRDHRVRPGPRPHAITPGRAPSTGTGSRTGRVRRGDRFGGRRCERGPADPGDHADHEDRRLGPRPPARTRRTGVPARPL